MLTNCSDTVRILEEHGACVDMSIKELLKKASYLEYKNGSKKIKLKFIVNDEVYELNYIKPVEESEESNNAC